MAVPDQIYTLPGVLSQRRSQGQDAWASSVQREQLYGWCASQPNRGAHEGRAEASGLAACWLFWEEPHQAHRLRLGCSTSRPVGELGLEEVPQPAQADFFLNCFGERRGG